MGYTPSYKWINPTYPIYNWGYNPLTKWDEPPSKHPTMMAFNHPFGGAGFRWPIHSRTKLAETAKIPVTDDIDLQFQSD